MKVKIYSIQWSSCNNWSKKGSSKEKLSQQLGLDSLSMRRWYRKLSLLFKIIKTESPPYLFNLVRNNNRRQITRNLNNLLIFRVNHEYFKNTFYPSAVLEWNKLDSFIRTSETFMLFKKRILKFIRPKPNSIFNIHNPVGIKYLTRLRLVLSHLKERKFKPNFQGSVDPLCSCGIETESKKHFLLHCANFSIKHFLKNTLKNTFWQINWIEHWRFNKKLWLHCENSLRSNHRFYHSNWKIRLSTPLRVFFFYIP